LRYNTYQVSRFIDHGKSADVILQHDVGRIDNGRICRDGENPVGHNLVGAHSLACNVAEYNLLQNPSPGDLGEAFVFNRSKPW
jgi:hypothetical protein